MKSAGEIVPVLTASTRQHAMSFTVSAEDAGVRLDQFLVTKITGASRAQIQRLIRNGCVRLSAGQAKPSLLVAPGLGVEVNTPPASPATPSPEPLPLTVLYDDADIVVVDKPAGMVVHPAAGHKTGTLVNALLHHVRGLSGIGGAERPGIVHRLDRGTSGVMIVAKHDRAHRELARQFHDREVEKEYVALVWGNVRAGQRLDQPIGRDRRHRQKMSSRSMRARPAVTEITGVEPFRGVSLARLRLGTGRTHQIRVHLSEHGHPVVGDELYGGTRSKIAAHLAVIAHLNRPFLHAARLSLAHPVTGRPMAFEAPLPPDLAAVVEKLRQSHS
jgi:23S rRNA pseudouridine1911/1915/1917 synthase